MGKHFGKIVTDSTSLGRVPILPLGKLYKIKQLREGPRMN